MFVEVLKQGTEYNLSLCTDASMGNIDPQLLHGIFPQVLAREYKSIPLQKNQRKTNQIKKKSRWTTVMLGLLQKSNPNDWLRL